MQVQDAFGRRKNSSSINLEDTSGTCTFETIDQASAGYVESGEVCGDVQTGEFERIYTDGSYGSATVTYVDGIATGPAEFFSTSGKSEQGRLKNGIREGKWTYKNSDGGSGYFTYRGGFINGPGYEVTADGTFLEGTYVNGRREGRWNETRSYGTKFETWVAGRLHGPTEWLFPNGNQLKGSFSDYSFVGSTWNWYEGGQLVGTCPYAGGNCSYFDQ